MASCDVITITMIMIVKNSWGYLSGHHHDCNAGHDKLPRGDLYDWDVCIHHIVEKSIQNYDYKYGSFYCNENTWYERNCSMVSRAALGFPQALLVSLIHFLLLLQSIYELVVTRDKFSLSLFSICNHNQVYKLSPLVDAGPLIMI